MQVFHKGEWGYICDDHWDIRDAYVVCRQLGFLGAKKELTGGRFMTNGSRKIWLDSVKCNGFESSISSCLHVGWGIHDCNNDELAGVICTNTSGKDRHYIFCLKWMLEII